jgi:predicted nucleic acid-binding protein
MARPCASLCASDALNQPSALRWIWPVRVILDTNILIANLRGARPSNDLKLVLADSRTGRFRLAVPDLVVEETVNKRREAAQDAERRLNKARSDLASVGAELDLPEFDVNAAGPSIGGSRSRPAGPRSLDRPRRPECPRTRSTARRRARTRLLARHTAIAQADPAGR